MATFSFRWRRHKVLKSGTGQSSPISRRRLSTNPVDCRNGIANLPGATQFRAETIHRIVSVTPFTLHSQAGLDRGIAEALLPATLAGFCRA